RVEEDRRPVLVADVPALAVLLGRVVVLPEGAQQLVVADLVGVELDLDRLGMTGRVRADLLVGGIVSVAACVSDGRGDDAGQSPERRLYAPEATGRECGFLCHVNWSRDRPQRYRAVECSFRSPRRLIDVTDVDRQLR